MSTRRVKVLLSRAIMLTIVMSALAPNGSSQSGFWAPATAIIACTPGGAEVSFTISGSELIAEDGDLADVQIRPSAGGTPIDSAFADVTKGNSGPYVVTFTSEALNSGSFQAWVFKVGTNDPVTSNIVSCGSGGGGETTPTPTAPVDSTPTAPVDSTPTPPAGGDGTQTPIAENPAGAVTELPQTGGGANAGSSMWAVMLGGALVLLLTGAISVRRKV